MNPKGTIFIKEFVERWIIVTIYGPQCFLVNAIDFIIQCSRMKFPYQEAIIELQVYKNAFTNVFPLSNDMELDIR